MSENEKRIIILNSFRDLCIQYGVDQFSMKKLSEICKMSMGSIYNIFPSRTDIFIETYKMCYGVIYNGLKTNDHFTVDELEIRLYLFINNCINNQNDFIFIHTFEYHPLNSFEMIYDENYKLGDATLGTLIDEHTVYRMSPYLIITIIIGIVSKALKYAIHQKIAISEEDKSHLVEAIMRAIIKKSKTSK